MVLEYKNRSFKKMQNQKIRLSRNGLPAEFIVNTHTHTHAHANTHTYIYIYIYFFFFGQWLVNNQSQLSHLLAKTY